MDITTILVILAVCIVYRLILNRKWLEWLVFLSSLLALYYFQPISTIRYYDFWIPTFTLLLVIFVWGIVVSQEKRKNKSNKNTLIALAAFFLILGTMRLFPQAVYSQFSSIPGPFQIVLLILISTGIILLTRNIISNKKLVLPAILIILVIFVAIKNRFLSQRISVFLRLLNKQSTSLASASEIIWIGYSYIAFRIIHVLLEYKKRGPIEVELRTFIGYTLFFPALLAGPIMKYDQFIKELESESCSINNDIICAFEDIAHGLFQKFILADTLAIISLNETLVDQVSEAKWMWIFVLVYSFRIYFDFSGYTHLAIGISRILGINLPDNFKRPLTSPTLTIFWNNWHITLTQWFRSYYFNPVTRLFRSKHKHLNKNIILAFMQISTMLLIGLWHGASLNFVTWGFWIGIGLFVQNQITGKVTRRIGKGNPFWKINKSAQVLTTFITFIYVSLGWIWFALPNLNSSIHTFRVLFGSK